jgi:hypothetical protein
MILSAVSMAHGGYSGEDKSSGHVLDTVIDFVCGSLGKLKMF